MKFIRTIYLSIICASITVVTACSQMQTPLANYQPNKQELQTLPYHPLAYHLDLSILAYKLYAQTLVWPFDPYYEFSNNTDGDRKRLMKKVHNWVKLKSKEQVKKGTKLGGFRGPGALNGFANNQTLNPIIYNYANLNPWGQTITQSENIWTAHQTPAQISNKISSVYMCYRQTGKPIGSVAVKQIASKKKTNNSGSQDVLLAFEGETGNKGTGQAAAQSLMGFILLRYSPTNETYDVHISFRGSQSGSVGRAAIEAFNNKKASGNPDWVTDLGYHRISSSNGGSHITSTGAVHRGFAQSMKSIFPQLFACLSKAAELSPKKGPNNIYVTGHSLGGGLAQHFTSAVILGTWYGPNGQGQKMPNTLRNWPWKQIKLITFSAPRAGNEKWAKTLTSKALSSDFFSSSLTAIDMNALTVNNQEITSRLSNLNKPASYRVLISTDPITTEKIVGGKHVGQTVYVDNASLFATATAIAHDPHHIRKIMREKLNSYQIPKMNKPVINNSKLGTAHSNRNKTTLNDYSQLANALKIYYSNNNISFNHKSFEKNVDLFKTIFKNEK